MSDILYRGHFAVDFHCTMSLLATFYTHIVSHDTNTVRALFVFGSIHMLFFISLYSSDFRWVTDGCSGFLVSDVCTST